ncbi:MAG: DUF4174 domain-containing protein [Pseudomonadota bacterium]
MRSAAVSVVVALGVTSPGSATDIENHLWESRPILIFADQNDPRLAEQLARFGADQHELDERNNVVIVDNEGTSALRSRFKPSSFTVVLIGKDGGEKFRSNDLVEPDTLHALIDTMPMRRREMRSSTSPED